MSNKLNLMLHCGSDVVTRGDLEVLNAFTEVLKGNASKALVRTQALHRLCDLVCGLSV